MGCKAGGKREGEEVVEIQAQVKNADAMTWDHGGAEPSAEPTGPAGKFPQ